MCNVDCKGTENDTKSIGSSSRSECITCTDKDARAAAGFTLAAIEDMLDRSKETRTALDECKRV